MGNGAGNEMLKQAIEASITANKNPSVDPAVCKSHEGIRLAAYAHSLWIQDQMQNGINENGKVELFGGKLLSVQGVHVTGRDLVMICLMVLVMVVACKELIPALLKW